MRHRLATVFWWGGALIGAGLLAIAILALQASKDGWIAATMAGIGLVIITIPCWALAFVLGGSFWKPPARPE